MGMLGRFIDGLTPQQKDRVIEAQTFWWLYKANREGLTADQGCGCLIDTALARRNAFVEYGEERVHYGASHRRFLSIEFDRLIRRFGPERIIRACKMRAAKPQFILPAVSRRTILQSSL